MSSNRNPNMQYNSYNRQNDDTYQNDFNEGLKVASENSKPQMQKYKTTRRFGYLDGYFTGKALNQNGFQIDKYYLPYTKKIQNFDDVNKYYNNNFQFQINKSLLPNKNFDYKMERCQQSFQQPNKQLPISPSNEERFHNYKGLNIDLPNHIEHIKYFNEEKQFKKTDKITTNDIFHSVMIYFVSKTSNINEKIIYISFAEADFVTNNVTYLITGVEKAKDGSGIIFNHNEIVYDQILISIQKFFKENYSLNDNKEFIIATSDTHSFWLNIIIPFCLMFKNIHVDNKQIIFKVEDLYKHGHLVYNGDLIESIKKDYETWKEPVIEEDSSEIKSYINYNIWYLKSNHDALNNKQLNENIFLFSSHCIDLFSANVIFIKGDDFDEKRREKFKDWYIIRLTLNVDTYEYLFKHGMSRVFKKYKGLTIKEEGFIDPETDVENNIIQKFVYLDILRMNGKNANIDIDLNINTFIEKCKTELGNELIKNKRTVIYGHNLDYLLINMIFMNQHEELQKHYIRNIHYGDEKIKKDNDALNQKTFFYPKHIMKKNESKPTHVNPIYHVIEAQSKMMNHIDSDPLNLLHVICLDNIRAKTYILKSMTGKFYGSGVKKNLNFMFNLFGAFTGIMCLIILIVVIILYVTIKKQFKTCSCINKK